LLTLPYQGIRFIFTDNSRIIFRLSGTGSVGATIRLYVEQYTPPTGDLLLAPQTALKPLIDIALALCEMENHTGRTEPTVIT
jgi:phosphoglucomutase